jgi:hypothetical protein
LAERTGVERIVKLVKSKQTALTAPAYQLSARLLLLSKTTKAPTDQETASLVVPALKPLISQALDLKANRKLINHAEAVSEAI